MRRGDFLIATRHATSLQTSVIPYAHARTSDNVGVNGIATGAWCARMVGAVGGGIFAKTAKTPPLQSGVCGDFIAIRIAPKGRPWPPPPCAYHATHGDPGFYNDAARRVATVFE